MRNLFALLAVVLFTLVPGDLAEAGVAHRVSPEESNAALRFWTPDRVAEAMRRDPMFGQIPSSVSVPGSSVTRNRPVRVFRPEVGKILGWDRYGAYSCSGAVINTPSLRLILTAGHCVYYNDAWARKLLFIPNFHRGSRPYGTYRIKASWVSNGWYRFAYGTLGMNYDIAILVTRRTWNGRRIGENVGAIDYQAFPARRGVTDIYGYPAGAMRGRVMRTCRSHTRADRYSARFVPGPTGILARCNMAGGSSGGPWVSRYRKPGGGTVGVIDGLTSTGFRAGGKAFLTSPYFGRILVSLIRSAEGR
ncbi:MAG: hypothetical protein IT199_05860 [Solirubrobacterales bacterium]|nr:hypothetical protein [Solirubrobacterales bacterium]